MVLRRADYPRHQDDHLYLLLYSTLTVTASDAMPFAITTKSLSPVSVLLLTSKLVDAYVV